MLYFIAFVLYIAEQKFCLLLLKTSDAVTKSRYAGSLLLDLPVV